MIHVLEADSIVFEPRGRKTLSDIYLRCETGKISGLLGRNGVGKTCLMNIIYGNLNPLSKSIRIDHLTQIHAFKNPDLLSFLPQFNFIPKGLKIQRFFSDFRLDFEMFLLFFPEYIDKYKKRIGDLSAGERRLVEVYSIIKTSAYFTILDEPFTLLMPLQIEKVMSLIIEEKAKKGFLITDHIYQQVIDISDILYLLDNGKTHLIKNMADIQRLGYVKSAK